MLPDDRTPAQRWGLRQKPFRSHRPSSRTHRMTLRNSTARTEPQFEGEGSSEPKEREICIHQASAASQILFWAPPIHLQPGLQARNLDVTGDPWMSQVTPAAPFPHTMNPADSTPKTDHHFAPVHTPISSSCLEESNSLLSGLPKSPCPTPNNLLSTQQPRFYQTITTTVINDSAHLYSAYQASGTV